MAVGAVVVRAGDVLLVRRGRPPGRGLWSIPGGAVRLGEPLEAALRRELREETGLEVRPEAVVKVVERILPEGGRIRYHYVIVDYACTVAGGELRAASDAEEARWVPCQDLEAWGLTGETREVLCAGWRMLQDLPRPGQ